MFITFWVRREWLSSCLLQKFCWREVWRDVSEKPRLCVPNVAFRITESNSTILCHVVVDEHLHTIMNCNGMEQEPKRRHGHRIDSAMRPLTRRNANPRLSFGLPIANQQKRHHHDAFLSRTRTKWHPCGRDDQHSLSLLLNCLGRASSGKIRSKRRFRHNKHRRQNIDTFFDSIQRRLFEALNFAFFHSVVYYGKSPLF